MPPSFAQYATHLAIVDDQIVRPLQRCRWQPSHLSQRFGHRETDPEAEHFDAGETRRSAQETEPESPDRGGPVASPGSPPLDLLGSDYDRTGRRAFSRETVSLVLGGGKPLAAMNRCHRSSYPEGRPYQSRRSAPKAIRYQAKAAKLERATNATKTRTTRTADTNETTNPTAKTGMSPVDRDPALLRRSYPAAAIIVG